MLVTTVFAYIKAIGTYIQILGLIISGPISLALGAIPSFEKQTVKWFKSLLAKSLSIPLMFGILDLSRVLSWNLLFDMVGLTDNPDWGGIDEAINVGISQFLGIRSILATIIACIVLIGGALYARKVPEKLEELIMGEDAAKPKRK